MFSRRTRVLLFVAALVLGALLGYARIHTSAVMMQDTGSVPAPAVQPMAGLNLGGPFTLTGMDGQIVSEKSWPGQYLLVYFGFTHCPDVCPLGLGRLTEALDALPAGDIAHIQPLFITIDPARDTAAELKKYVTLFHPKLVGLTGTQAQIDAVIGAYRVYAQKEPVPGGDAQNYMMNHSSYTYLVAPDAQVIDVYAHDTAPAEMAKKIAAQIQEHTKAVPK